MDPISSLGLAGNILQVLDFSCKLLRETRAIYKSATGTSEENVTLKLIADDLVQFTASVEASTTHETSQALRTLAKETQLLSRELQAALDGLRVRGKKTRWNSFTSALKDVWHRDKVEGLAGRISRLQAQMNSHVQFQVRDQLAQLSQGIADMELCDWTHDLRRKEKISSHRADQDRWQKTWAAANSQHSFQDNNQPLLPSETASPPGSHCDQYTKSDAGLHDLVQSLVKLASELSELEKDQKLLLSLWFEAISARENAIPETHRETFLWVFKNTCPDGRSEIHFVDWLQSSQGIFWVCGKAGSGKSMLMKLIAQHPQTRTYLESWAGGHKLITCRFYFWLSGSDLQKSHAGLLRSLLFEILRGSPELLPPLRQHLAQRQSDSLGPDYKSTLFGPWQCEELTAVLRFVLERNPDTKFCFFVDGLDEYKADGNRDHAYLIQTLQMLATSPSIKLCLSSRPWTVFLDAFGSEPRCTLRLEELTRRDIQRYVNDKISQHGQFDKLARADSAYEQLASEVTHKAQGVFLWVFLVVRELLEGLTYNDTIRTMRLRLSEFPTDLESYFQRMFNSIPKCYRRETAQMFRIALANKEPPLLLTYAFFDDINEDQDEQLLTSLDETPAGEFSEVVHTKFDTMRRRLDGRCRGLLEVVGLQGPRPSARQASTLTQYRVDFLHRTVRDYLQNTGDSAGLMQDVGLEAVLWTNYHRALAHTMIALRHWRVAMVRIFERLWDDMLAIACMAVRGGANSSPINRNLDRVMRLGLGGMHYTRLLSQACRFALLDYVDHSLKFQSPAAKRSLGEEIFPSALVQNPIFDDFSPDLVKYLLALGVDVKKSPVGLTEPAKTLVTDFQREVASGELEPLAQYRGLREVMEILSSHGVEFHATEPRKSRLSGDRPTESMARDRDARRQVDLAPYFAGSVDRPSGQLKRTSDMSQPPDWMSETSRSKRRKSCLDRAV